MRPLVVPIAMLADESPTLDTLDYEAPTPTDLEATTGALALPQSRCVAHVR